MTTLLRPHPVDPSRLQDRPATSADVVRGVLATPPLFPGCGYRALAVTTWVSRIAIVVGSVIHSGAPLPWGAGRPGSPCFS